MIGVTVSVNSKDVETLGKKLPDNIDVEMKDTVFNYTRTLSKALRLAAITDPIRPITPARQRAAAQILAKRISKYKSKVTMPRSLALLDSMKPHHVSLKRGRNITKWAGKNFRHGVRVSGKSRVGKNSQGQITRTYTRPDGSKGISFLYVTPHPFVKRTMNKERRKLPNKLRRALQVGVTKPRK